jgi:ABC-2 type transport system ATP-binding protein
VLRVVDLTVRFPGVVALDGVGFEAHAGEVLGVLGPNGAGKTTAMRVITGFLRPGAGRVEIDGIDVAEEGREARRRLGYLAENAPLYSEMRVGEYLDYRAGLKEIARAGRRAAIDRAIDAVDLGEVRTRIIGQLSKGYRQRVGLADALLGEPPLLVLDEPTDGLDPNQRHDALGLIARLGRERTVVVSTHVLPEVESLCRRVVILDRGRVVASGAPGELGGGAGRLRLVARGARAAIEAALAPVAGVRVLDATEGDGLVTLILAEDGDRREAVAEAVGRVAALRELGPAGGPLAELFSRLTRPEEP